MFQVALPTLHPVRYHILSNLMLLPPCHKRTILMAIHHRATHSNSLLQVGQTLCKLCWWYVNQWHYSLGVVVHHQLFLRSFQIATSPLFLFGLLGNIPVERAKDAVCFLQWCGMSLASSAIIYNIVKVKVTRWPVDHLTSLKKNPSRAIPRSTYIHPPSLAKIRQRTLEEIGNKQTHTQTLLEL